MTEAALPVRGQVLARGGISLSPRIGCYLSLLQSQPMAWLVGEGRTLNFAVFFILYARVLLFTTRKRIQYYFIIYDTQYNEYFKTYNFS